jgi:hypothetical protein
MCFYGCDFQFEEIGVKNYSSTPRTIVHVIRREKSSTFPRRKYAKHIGDSGQHSSLTNADHQKTTPLYQNPPDTIDSLLSHPQATSHMDGILTYFGDQAADKQDFYRNYPLSFLAPASPIITCLQCGLKSRGLFACQRCRKEAHV